MTADRPSLPLTVVSGRPKAAAARPPLSIVVVTRDRPVMLDRALAAVRRSASAQDELLVVDSASADPEAVREVAGRYTARVLRCDVPGETVARNLGWQGSMHEAIAYTDDDVWVHEGWADALASCLAAHSEAAFVTGRIDIPPGQGTLAVSIKADDEPEVFGRASRGLIGHAANLAVRRSALLAVGGFDELLGAGGRFHAAPDSDLFDRIFARGLTGRYEPRARAWHDQWRRVRDWVRLQHRYGIGSGARASKLLRSDRRRLRIALRTDVWEWGVRQLPSEVARRDWFRAVGTGVRLAGFFRGFALAMTVPVVDGHLLPRRGSSS